MKGGESTQTVAVEQRNVPGDQENASQLTCRNNTQSAD